MSKVLIDRAVLGATLEHAEFVSGAACEADDAIRAVLVAPSGTPVMPVKAYYHEAPNEHGGLNKSVGLEVRKTFIDTPLVLESDATARIACLEGEIANRDAELCERAEEVEHALADLNNALAELAAIKAQEPVAFAFRYDDGSWHDVSATQHSAGMVSLYAAPVSEAKAQGVVMPAELGRAFITGESCDGVYRVVIKSETLKEMHAVHRWITSLNAAPAPGGE